MLHSSARRLAEVTSFKRRFCVADTVTKLASISRWATKEALVAVSTISLVKSDAMKLTIPLNVLVDTAISTVVVGACIVDVCVVGAGVGAAVVVSVVVGSTVVGAGVGFAVVGFAVARSAVVGVAVVDVVAAAVLVDVVVGAVVVDVVVGAAVVVVGRVQLPLGVSPFHVTLPLKPCLHAQAGPASLLLFEMLHAAGMHSPLAVMPDHAILPEKPSLHAELAQTACCYCQCCMHPGSRYHLVSSQTTRCYPKSHQRMHKQTQLSYYCLRRCI